MNIPERLVKVTVYLPLTQKLALDRYKKNNLPYSHIVKEALGHHFEEVAQGNRKIVDYEKEAEALPE